MELEKVFSLIILSVSAWSALALLLDRRGHLGVNRCFAILLGVLCISQVFIYSLLIGSPASFIFAQLCLASIWLKGPLVLQLVRLLIGKSPSLISIGWHFSGFPLALAIMSLAPQSQLLWHFLGACVSVGVLLWSAILLWQHQPRLLSIYGEYKNTAAYWLLFLVVGMLALLLCDLVLFGSAIYLQAVPFAAVRIITFAASLYLICIAFFSIYRPEVFFRPRFVEQAIAPVADGATATEPAIRSPGAPNAETKANRNLELDDSVASILRQKLEQLMAVEDLYKQDELSLANIANLLDISVHQASELLNVHMQTNFYSYINAYRLKYAAELLSDAKCQLRVVDIVFESGFNNKNSFYREFRYAYGVTPTEYRNQQLLQAVS